MKLIEYYMEDAEIESTHQVMLKLKIINNLFKHFIPFKKMYKINIARILS